MKTYHKYILLFATILGLTLASCKIEDDIPCIDTTPINKSYLLGGWGVYNNSVKWELSTSGSAIAKIWNGKSRISDYISNSTNYASLYFANDSSVFYVRHAPTDSVPYICHSIYSLHDTTFNADTAGYYLTFSNPDFMSFYASRIYIKRVDNSDNNLVLYMRRSEVMDMLSSESEMSSYMSLIRSYVDNAEVDIYVQRDSLDYYKQIDKDWNITH